MKLEAKVTTVVGESHSWIKELRDKWQKPVVVTQEIQPLWSGYGVLCRISDQQQTYIAKYISPPDTYQHPKGWNGQLSHRRKLDSYRIEKNFYQHYVSRSDSYCRVPKLIDMMQYQSTQLLVLEDLHTSGFAETKNTVADALELKAVICWLAYFHMRFLAASHQGLWAKGCYWHLGTRQEEHQSMAEGELKQKAFAIDKKLSNARYQTLLHGDAKLANFCFTPQHHKVAAVDFQYTGTGVGIRDLMVLLSSSLEDHQLETQAEFCLDYYFQQLYTAYKRYQPSVDMALLEQEWRELWPYVWADYHRFLAGWSPGHQRINQFMLSQTRQTLLQLEQV